MRALVTGCAGFIGSHLVDSLLADGVAVTGLDCFTPNYDQRQKLRNIEGALNSDGFDFIVADISRAALERIVPGHDIVFHLAGEPGVRSSWGTSFGDYITNNISATQCLLEALRVCSGTRLVFASSSSVYGEAPELPTAETAPTRPLSPYGVTKLAGEHLCHAYHRSCGLDVVVLRYFSVYGPRQRPDMACHVFTSAIRDGRQMRVHGDGRHTRDFTYIDDVVAGTRLAARAAVPAGSTYNIAGGARVSVASLISMIAALAEKTADIAFGLESSGDVRDTGADITRARVELGFAPRTSLSAGLAQQWDWLRELDAPASAEPDPAAGRDARVESENTTH